MADAFSAQLRAIDARNAAMAGIGRARAGIQYEKETEQHEEAKREIARKQEAEAGRAQRVGAKVAERGTWGGFIGGTLGREFAKWGAKQAAGTAFKTVLGSTLGSIAVPAAAAYALSKALSHKKAKGFKGKEINEADIANIETEYFRKPQAKQIKYDLGQINTQIRSAGDIMKASRESIAQGFAMQFGTAALQEQALSSLFGGAGAGTQETETYKQFQKRMKKMGIGDVTMKDYKAMVLGQTTPLLNPYAAQVYGEGGMRLPTTDIGGTGWADVFGPRGPSYGLANPIPMRPSGTSRLGLSPLQTRRRYGGR